MDRPVTVRTYLDFEKPVAELESKIAELKAIDSDDDAVSITDEVTRLQQKAQQALVDTYAKLTPWQKTQVARHPDRPHSLDYVRALIEDFTPLAGDRYFAEDAAIMGGLGRFRGRPIVVIGHEKGSDTESRIKHNFGMARPEGYRKAVRLMDLAEKFDLPVLYAGRYGRRLSRHRRRGARPGRGDRPVHGSLPVAGGAADRRRHRRRRLGRCRRHRHRQSRAHAGALDLHGGLARSRRLDPVAGRGSRHRRRHRHEDHGAGPEGPGRHRCHHPRAGRVARTATRPWCSAARATSWRARSTSFRGWTPTPSGASATTSSWPSAAASRAGSLRSEPFQPHGARIG